MCRECGRKQRRDYKKNLPPEVKRRWHKRDDNRRRERLATDPDFRQRTKDKDHDRYIRRKDRLRARRKRLEKERPFLLRSNKTIHEHRKKGFKIEITMRELEMLMNAAPIKCAFCSEPFETDLWRSRTVDRIDNVAVLSASTIRIICYRCNTMKGNMKDVEFIEKCRKIAENMTNV